MLQVIIWRGDNTIVFRGSMTLIIAKWESHLEIYCTVLHVPKLNLNIWNYLDPNYFHNHLFQSVLRIAETNLTYVASIHLYSGESDRGLFS